MEKKIIMILFTIFIGFSTFSKEIETVGTISNVEEVEEGYFGYQFTYSIDKNSAYYNIDGEFIEGPLTSTIFTEMEPIDGQEVKMKYDSEEPMFFKIIDEIKSK